MKSSYIFHIFRYSPGAIPSVFLKLLKKNLELDTKPQDSLISDFLRSIKENQIQDFLDQWNADRCKRERIYIITMKAIKIEKGI